MVHNIPYVQGSTQALVIIHCLSKQGMGGLEGHINLPALQQVPRPSRSYVGGEGHGHLLYKYT